MKVGKYLSPYVRTVDVKEPVTLVLEAVEEQEIGAEDDRKKKLVAYFDKLEQGVVLGSKAVLGFFAEEFGEDTDDWIGQTVVMFNEKSITFKGKRTGGIRFKLPEVEEGGEES